VTSAAAVKIRRLRLPSASLSRHVRARGER